MHTTTDTTYRPGTAPSGRNGLRLLIAAVGFLACYLLVDLVTGLLATTALPMPTDSIDAVRDWYTQNTLAGVVMGVLQAVSVAFLAWYATAYGDRRARGWGYLAVALMFLSCCCAWVLAAVAEQASSGLLTVLRQVNFIAGGTAHVVALGLFVLFASTAGGFGRTLRVVGAITAAVAVLSLSSLVFDKAAAFILLGRLLAMVWTICAAISILRRQRAGRSGPASAA